MKHHLHLLLAASLAAVSIGASAADWTATRIGPFNNQGFAVVDINNAGQVLGQYAPDPFTLRGFLYTPGSSGGLVDLGSFGGRGTIPTALNASGQVAGWSETSDGFAHGFIFKDGRMQRLSLAGEMMGNATDINDRGQVLVHSTSADRVGRDAIFHPAGPPTVLSVPTDSGSAGAPLGPQGINNRGQVFGSWSAPGGGGSYYYANGQWVDIGTLGGDRGTTAVDMNGSGQIVGTSNGRPFLYSDGKIAEIGPGTRNAFGVAFDINDRGQVLVNWTSNDFANTEAVLYSDGQEQKIADFSGGGLVRDLNELGQVVGIGKTMGQPSEQHAFFYSDGETTDVTRWLMNSFPDVALVENGEMELNDLGQFTVNALLTNGQRAIFVLTPIPEPSTYALMLGGLGALAWIAWRQRRSP